MLADMGQTAFEVECVIVLVCLLGVFLAVWGLADGDLMEVFGLLGLMMMTLCQL